MYVTYKILFIFKFNYSRITNIRFGLPVSKVLFTFRWDAVLLFSAYFSVSEHLPCPWSVSSARRVCKTTRTWRARCPRSQPDCGSLHHSALESPFRTTLIKFVYDKCYNVVIRGLFQLMRFFFLTVLWNLFKSWQFKKYKAK